MTYNVCNSYRIKFNFIRKKQKNSSPRKTRESNTYYYGKCYTYTEKRDLSRTQLKDYNSVSINHVHKVRTIHGQGRISHRVQGLFVSSNWDRTMQEPSFREIAGAWTVRGNSHWLLIWVWVNGPLQTCVRSLILSIINSEIRDTGPVNGMGMSVLPSTFKPSLMARVLAIHFSSRASNFSAEASVLASGDMGTRSKTVNLNDSVMGISGCALKCSATGVSLPRRMQLRWLRMRSRNTRAWPT